MLHSLKYVGFSLAILAAIFLAAIFLAASCGGYKSVDNSDNVVHVMDSMLAAHIASAGIASASMVARRISSFDSLVNIPPPPPPPPPPTCDGWSCCTGHRRTPVAEISQSAEDSLAEAEKMGRLTIKEEPLYYDFVEEMPYFSNFEGDNEQYKDKKKCGDEYLRAFIYEELKYPAEALAKKTEGTVVISFIVDELGNLGEIVLRKTIGGGCDEEALRIIGQLADLPQKWVAGKQQGKAVKVRYNMPIRFKISKVSEF